jgi:ethanolamine utilization protein EutN
MKLCRVTGSTVASVKAPALERFALLTVRPEQGDGPELVAVDFLGAGEGDVVLVVTGGAARELEATRGAPVDAAVVAIVDRG